MAKLTDMFSTSKTPPCHSANSPRTPAPNEKSKQSHNSPIHIMFSHAFYDAMTLRAWLIDMPKSHGKTKCLENDLRGVNHRIYVGNQTDRPSDYRTDRPHYGL